MGGILIKAFLDMVPGDGYRTYIILALLLIFGLIEIFYLGDAEGGIQTVLLSLAAMFGKVKVDKIEEKLVSKAEEDFDAIIDKAKK